MKINKKIFFSHRVLLIICGALLIAGIIFQWLYDESPQKIINIRKIEKVIAQKEKKADVELNKVASVVEHISDSSLRKLASEPLANSYFVYKNNHLIFWNKNELKHIYTNSSEWKYYLTPNAHILAKTIHIRHYKIVCYILIKYNFPYENNELSNDFSSAFELNKTINIVQGNSNDKFAIHNPDDTKNYLFTLQLPENIKLYNENWARIALILFVLFFLTLFYLYARFPLLLKKTWLSPQDFFIVSFSMFIIVIACLIFDIPSTFFRNNIFTSFHYASNPLLATLTHLTIFTFYVFSTIYLFCYSVKKGVTETFKYIKIVFLILLPVFYFLLMFNILTGMVFNSSTDLNVLSINNFTTSTLWNHFLLLIWGLGYILLFFKTHRIVRRNNNLFEIIKIDIALFVLVILFNILLSKKYAAEAIISYFVLTLVLYLPEIIQNLKHSKWFLILFFAVFTLFVVDNSVRMNSDKKMSQFRLLAENIYFNETSQEEKITESMFSDLDKELVSNIQFRKLSVNPDSVATANKYLNEKYLRGYWSKFEMKLFSTYPQSDVDKSYMDILNSSGNNLQGTHFHKIVNSPSGMAYLGFFKLIKNKSDSVNVYLEFYPRSNYKSYSYPDLLIQSTPSIQSRLSFSTARYFHDNLIFSSGKFKYPRSGKWINEPMKDFFVQDFSGSRHYIYAPSKYSYMLVSEANIPSTLSYLLYYLYTFVAFLIVSLFFFWLNNLLTKKKQLVYNLTSKLLISFISLMIVCFAAIFYVSYGYTLNKYKQKQLADIGLKKSYVQTALQQEYYWNQKLDSTITTKLNFDLQDLSYTYQTDINVYDNFGNLIGTSQPAIFNKNLVDNLISPKPFFSNNPNIDQYEHIGKLEYLATYTDFYNGEFLPIGYISIPQFLSKDEYNTDVEGFLAVIAHISLIIIILFIVISVIIGKQLTAPLTLIEDRLKDIRLGKENKKIDYKGNDEIGQLVTQYNRTVDELERSAQLLASSERESAWKLMARQIAHEINNPLTPMKLTIQQLQRSKTKNDERFDAYFDKSTTILIEQIENLSQIAGTFSNFARLPEPKLEKVDVAKEAYMVTQLFSNNNENVKITFEGDEKDVFTLTDDKQIVQVFNNLLKNAFQAIPSGEKGEIEVSIKHSDKAVEIDIKDNGTGVPDNIKEKLFTPNFTSKSTGMGLGLAISRNIIRASGGDITFESESGKGSVFRVSLPRVKSI